MDKAFWLLFLAAAVCLQPSMPLRGQASAEDAVAAPSPAEKVPFVVQKEPGPERRFVPSGQIGDAEDITLVDAWNKGAKEGETCVRIEYDAKGSKGEKWAGVYWQHPDFNFGDVPNAGFNLKSARRLVFWARGEKGGERVEVKVGGIKGTYPDSCDMPLKTIDLSRSWKKFTISLEDKDLSYVIGAFFVSFTQKNCPSGAVIYLDNIVFE